MHKLFKNLRLNLQFHADGAAAGDGGDGASTAGVTSDVAGQDQSDRLISLGVPKAKADKYKGKAPAAQKNVAPAADTATTKPESNPDEERWEQAKKDPYINKKMQEAMSARLKKNGDAQQTLEQLKPMLDLIGKKTGVDVSDLSKLDVNGLVKAVTEDPSYYEDMAADMGVDVKTARQIYSREREAQQAEKEAKRQRQEQLFRKHIDGMKQQEQSMKQAGININLQQELEDPTFRDRTAPQPTQGLSVQDAYRLKYFDQIVADEVNKAVRQATSSISNKLQSRRGVPAEAGTVSRPGVQTQTKSYADMTPAERAVEYKRITGRDYPRRR